MSDCSTRRGYQSSRRLLGRPENHQTPRKSSRASLRCCSEPRYYGVRPERLEIVRGWCSDRALKGSNHFRIGRSLRARWATSAGCLAPRKAQAILDSAMSARKEVPLPENSTEILRQVSPVLEQFLDKRKFVIGGGSVLAARWQHRRSFDVDLFTTDAEGTMAVHRQGDQLRCAVGRLCGDRVSVSTTPRHGEIVLEETGIVEWALVHRLAERPPTHEIDPVSGMQLDCTEEILAQKLYTRMYQHGGRAIRDIYDLAWAIEHEGPACLVPAIRFFGSDNGRAMLAVIREVRDGFLAIDSRRPLVDPADPSLEERAITVLYDHLEGVWPSPGKGRQGGTE